MLQISVGLKGMLTITLSTRKKSQLFDIRENYIKSKERIKVFES